jgi:hypothetical protein
MKKTTNVVAPDATRAAITLQNLGDKVPTLQGYAPAQPAGKTVVKAEYEADVFEHHDFLEARRPLATLKKNP